jgi:hypothetical protein
MQPDRPRQRDSVRAGRVFRAGRGPLAAWGHHVLAAVLCTTGGCRIAATPHTGPIAAGPSADAPSRTEPRVGILELEVLSLRHEPHDELLSHGLWDLVDEQALDPETRRRLAANGLRGGVITGGLPTALVERLTAATRDPAFEPLGSRRVLRLLPGRRAEIVSSPARPELVVLEHDGASVHGATYRDASGLVALRVWPGGDGRMRIEAVPELRHGPSRRTWVGEEGAFRLEAGQACRRLEGLAIDAELPARGLLVIGCDAAAPSSVGQAILEDRAGSTTAIRQLLVISPLTAGADPLFGAPVDGSVADFSDEADRGDEVVSQSGG